MPRPPSACDQCCQSTMRVHSRKCVWDGQPVRHSHPALRHARRFKSRGTTVAAASDKAKSVVDIITAAPVTEITEIKDVMDLGMQGFDRFIAENLRRYIPVITYTQLTILTQVVVFAAIVVVFSLLGKITHWCHEHLVRDEKEEGMDNKPQAATATILKPLARLLPSLGWLLAFQRLVTGMDNMVVLVDKNKKHVAPLFSRMVHRVSRCTSPLKAVLANAIGILILVSLTWTLLLLKKRWFNSFLTRMSVDASNDEAADLKRVLVPANDLATWLIIGVSGATCLRIFGVDPSPLLALGSVSGIVVGFASQNLLLNLISGISIFLTRPFVVGDMVAVHSSGTLIAQGTIANISPLRTTFVDDMSRCVTLPNKVLSDMVITNFRKTRQLTLNKKQVSEADNIKLQLEYEFTLRPPHDHLGGPYDTFAEAVIRAILVRLSILRNIVADSATAYVCDLDTIGQIRIRVLATGRVTDATTPDSVRQDFLLSIHRALSASAAEIHS